MVYCHFVASYVFRNAASASLYIAKSFCFYSSCQASCKVRDAFRASSVYKEFSPYEHCILLHCIHVFSLRCIFAGFLLTVPSCGCILWPPWYCRCPLICPFKQAAYLLVGGLRKLSVPVANCNERLRSYNAY